MRAATGDDDGGLAQPIDGPRAVALGRPRPTLGRAGAMAMPTGRLIAKTQRQPRVLVSTPPSSGPDVAATPAIAPQSPNARARLGGSRHL